MMEQLNDTRYFKFKLLTTLINNNLSSDKSPPLLIFAFKTLPREVLIRSDVKTTCATEKYFVFIIFEK